MCPTHCSQPILLQNQDTTSLFHTIEMLFPRIKFQSAQHSLWACVLQSVLLSAVATRVIRVDFGREKYFVIGC